mmetsp:Transcript_5544/g.16537  ORF Transcript_5544/g.16537 Transcript_5544/m.16537 type:complete len:358 (-) Transcript_5544:124-1197(-)
MSEAKDTTLEDTVAEAASKLAATSLDDENGARREEADGASEDILRQVSRKDAPDDGSGRSVKKVEESVDVRNKEKYGRHYRELAALCESLKQGEVKKVVVVTGAGVSTAAGVPDFRSEDGIYQRLRKHNISRPELIFDISFFRKNPVPFYKLAKELHAENIKPTFGHYFIKLLDNKGLLRRLYTQNIDGLDHATGVDKEKVIEAHGSFATARCISCSKPATELAKQAVRSGNVPKCPQCKSYVKPDIVFFGESLPDRFYQCFEKDARESDLCIVLGSSLQVYPVAAVPVAINRGVKRLLINRETAGDFGQRQGDILALGDIEDVVQDIAEWCGWREELHSLRNSHKAANPAAASTGN